MTKVPELRYDGFEGEWESKKLKETSQITGGGTPSTSDTNFWNGNINWFTPSEINDKRYFSESERKISELGLMKSSAKLLDKNKTILFTSRATIGNIGLLTEDSTTNQGFQSLVIKDEYDLKFMYSLCETIKNKALSLSTGSTFREISKSDFQNLLINTPQYKEQEKIGDLLSKIDQLIESQQELVDQTIAFKKSMLQKMFPKKDSLVPEFRFEGFDNDWKLKKLSELGKTITGNTPSTKNELYWSESEEYIWITPSDIDGPLVVESERYLSELGLQKSRFLPANSVLITSIASIGKNAINIKPVSINQQINAIIPESHDSYFILESMNHSASRFESLAGRSATQIINKTTFDGFKILIPSLEEQEKIGNFFKNLDEKIASEEKLLESYKDMKKSLLQKMFV
ncbi:restriction endonuclease subunit S [Anaerococcus octavius]|jgi:putative type I S-subunit protein|uniref:Type I restriction modification DNA specificity domain-containing protein n=1 Tax=Anaerococcus octavius TaxID=54007 RepID=A0A2I1M9G1_9FIRM|nr:restriction endonuclease subunit S [Anaerococcus octavius]PKZ16761.1 hypothetical protein CYJ34_02965 [Anaerococcus octavius]